MRARTLLVPLVATAGCAAMSSAGSSVAKFQGVEAVKRRIKEIEDKSTVAGNCANGVKESQSGGIEVTAAADGKLAARSLWWQGTPAVEACIVDAARKATLTPLPGPPVSALWELRAKDLPAPPPPDSSKLSVAEFAPMQERVGMAVEACQQRHLSDGFSADIELYFVILPGGKTGVVNIMHSSAGDGDFDTCVQSAIGGTQFPDPHYPGAFPFRMKFHVGPSDKL